MQQSMIYGDSPDFDEILRRLKFFNGQVRLMGTGLALEAIIRRFADQHQAAMEADPERLIYKGNLSLITPAGEAITLQLELHNNMSGGWVFEEILW